jgi:hypothetical protein
MMRRCVTTCIPWLVLVIKPGTEMLLNAAIANDGSQISNNKRVHGDACLRLRACASRVLVAPPTTNFCLCLALCQKFVLSRQPHQHRDGRAPLKIAPFTARSGRSAYRYENRYDHANGTRDYLAWWSVLRHLFHPSQSRPMNCSERS